MKYDFKKIEAKWQNYWVEQKVYKVDVDLEKPKFYVLDMFPYPSGAGLHVGHPLGYIASDIYSRYKTLKGFNVLHPMGYDAFGLPAEQYAIQTGQHPAQTTDQNIKRYRQQLDQIGFSFDWSREIKTSDPNYYKWTQWAFIEMFHSWFNKSTNKAESIESLIEEFDKSGSSNVRAATDFNESFTSQEWKDFDERQRERVLQHFRLAYLADTMVNWCPELGTVLANDEVKDGLSVRGGHPVVQKKMKQWCLRVSAYSQRLLDGLEKLDWSDSLKEMQKNWIGRSEGANIHFQIKGSNEALEIFTTRPDTIFGATYMVIAPESDLAQRIITSDQREEASNYIQKVLKKSERDRLQNQKEISGVFSGSYAIHPFSKQEIPIWIADYVLAGYGSGAIMAVPAHDERDYAFAKHFNLPIVEVVSGGDIEKEAFIGKDQNALMVNSDFLNGLSVKDAIDKVGKKIKQENLGDLTVNYRLRDAIFSRQRYWGEPFPIYYENGLPKTLPQNQLPLELPEIDAFLPTEDGSPPLGRAQKWETQEGYPLELSTMPGFAGSSAYYFRYMDPHNKQSLVSQEASNYWQDVDLYIGGTEHATGHLIYSRFWNKFLFDRGHCPKDEPFKKLVNQGMIQGRSQLVYRIKENGKATHRFVSFGLKDQYETMPIHIDVNLVTNDILDIENFKKWRPDFKDAEFILENGQYQCGHAIEKMSKSLFNVVNPDDVISEYGADTFRLYEMFLGPIDQSKPWNTGGIEGVSRFIQKFLRLFTKDDTFYISDDQATEKELKILHKTIKKVEEDIKSFSYNTAISQLMICTNELTTLKCNKREVLEKLTIVLSPFAPHLCEELWHEALGQKGSVTKATFPEYAEQYLVETTFKCPIGINGKTKAFLELPLDLAQEEVEKRVLSLDKVNESLKGKELKKIIVVKNKIVNLVVK